MIVGFTADGHVQWWHATADGGHLATVPLAQCSYPPGTQDVLAVPCPVCQAAGVVGGLSVPISGGADPELGQLLHLRKAYVTAAPGTTFLQVRQQVVARIARLDGPGRERLTALVQTALDLARAGQLAAAPAPAPVATAEA